MKAKTSELSGTALDYAVARSQGLHTAVRRTPEGKTWMYIEGTPNWPLYSPSTDWSQGGPIIEREKIELFVNHSPLVWSGFITKYPKRLSHYTIQQSGSAPLIAAMRCFVASKLGEEVEIPEELIK